MGTAFETGTGQVLNFGKYLVNGTTCKAVYKKVGKSFEMGIGQIPSFGKQIGQGTACTAI